MQQKRAQFVLGYDVSRPLSMNGRQGAFSNVFLSGGNYRILLQRRFEVQGKKINKNYYLLFGKNKNIVSLIIIETFFFIIIAIIILFTRA